MPLPPGCLSSTLLLQCKNIDGCSAYDGDCKCTACSTGELNEPRDTCVSGGPAAFSSPSAWPCSLPWALPLGFPPVQCAAIPACTAYSSGCGCTACSAGELVNYDRLCVSEATV